MAKAAPKPAARNGNQSRRRRTPAWRLFKTAFQQWSEDNPFQLAAALAYYTLFSMAPLLILLIGMVGIFLGTAAAENYIVDTVSGFVGSQSGEAIRQIIRNADDPGSGLIAGIIGTILLLVGAGGVVGQLQQSLNLIWGVAAKASNSWWDWIRKRLFSYAMILAIGFLLLVSLVVSAAVSALTRYFTSLLPAGAEIWQSVDILVSFAFVTGLFAIIYKFLPDVRIAWKDVWVGAALTSLLFSLGKFAIGLYLGRSAVSSVYGAAGSLITVLLWVYYSGLIFFYGAEITQVYATQYGSGVVPTSLADRSSKERIERDRGVRRAEN